MEKETVGKSRSDGYAGSTAISPDALDESDKLTSHKLPPTFYSYAKKERKD